MIGCLAWICTRTNGVKARHAAVTPRGNGLVEPEVVATSPYRIKSPVPVCCGFDSVKWCSRQASHLHWRRSQRRVSAVGLRELLAQGQAWILQPVMLRQNRFTKAIRRLLHGGKWSQSPVPPRTRRAYETHLSPGSTAVLAHGHQNWSPHPELHRANSLTERTHR